MPALPPVTAASRDGSLMIALLMRSNQDFDKLSPSGR